MRGLAVLLLFAGAAAAQDAGRTLKVYDDNRDGVLTKNEFPDAAAFAKADRDGDGEVTEDELAIFLGLKKAPPPPKNETEKPEAKKPAPEAKKESVSDGGVRKRPFTVPERVKDFFRRFDRNDDRKVDKKEAAGIGGEMWERFDRNNDEAFNYREATRYVRFTLEEAKKRPTRANFFELFDRNRDRKVTKREYDGPPAFFRQYDHDKDRVVTEDELNMGANAGGMSRRQMEADEEFMADGPTKAPKRTLVDRYDANGDGRVTLEELKGAEALMLRLDRNGDGVLSGRETR